jgi:hypothetical protein
MIIIAHGNIDLECSSRGNALRRLTPAAPILDPAALCPATQSFNHKVRPVSTFLRLN